jgi:uncharacterized membrane protein
MFDGIKLLTFVFSAINMSYMFVMKDNFYGEFIHGSSFVNIMFAYIAWACMSVALKWYVIDRKDFGYKSVFTHGPLLGFIIYAIMNICLMTVRPDWSAAMASTDVFFGTGMFMMVSLFALIFKKFL